VIAFNVECCTEWEMWCCPQTVVEPQAQLRHRRDRFPLGMAEGT